MHHHWLDYHLSMTKALLAILLLLPFAVGAEASDSWSCSSEHSVGLKFEAASNSWEALTIPDHGYVLRPSPKFDDRYEAVLVFKGTSVMYYCETMPNDWIVECTSSNDGVSEVTFNTKTLKFRSHGFGSYLSDQNSDSLDYVSVGNCTRLP